MSKADVSAASGLHRATRQRHAIDTAIATVVGEPVSAQTLHQQLRDAGLRVGLTTVYRRLHYLADSHQIDSVRSPNGELLYRSCEHRADYYTLTCRRCGTAAEIHAPDLRAWAEATGPNAGFRSLATGLSMSGFCDDCTDGNSPPAATQ